MTRLVASVQGDAAATLAAEGANVDRAVKTAVVRQVDESKQDTRGLIDRAFPPRSGAGRAGKRIANAIRGKVYNDRPGKWAGIVFSRFGKKRGGRWQDFFAPHATGATITARAGRSLLLPIASRSKVYAAIAGLKRHDPTVDIIPQRGHGALIVRRRGTRLDIIASLVRKVRIRKKLDMRPVRDRTEAGFVQKLTAALEGQS